MSESANFIVQHIAAAFSGEESEEQLAIISELHQFCSTIESFSPLIEIINSNNEEKIKRECVLLINTLFTKIDPEVLNGNEEIWAAIFDLLFSAQTSATIKADIISNIINVFSSAALFATGIRFLAQVHENISQINQQNLDICLKLISIISKSSKSISDIGAQVLEIVSKGLEYQNSITFVYALRAGIQFCETFGMEQIMQYYELIPPLLQSCDDNSFAELSRLFCWISDEEANGFDPSAFIEAFLANLGNEALSEKRRRAAYDVIKSFYDNYDDLIENHELCQQTFQATLSLCEKQFNEEDSRDMTPYDLFYIFSNFGRSTELLNGFSGTFEELSASTLGCFCVSEFILNTSENGLLFYEQNIEQIVTILNAFLESECLSVRESATQCLSYFLTALPHAMHNYAATITQSIFSSFSENVSEEMLSCFYEIIDKTKDTEAIFTDAIAQLTEILGESRVDGIILKTIAALVNGSAAKAQEHFDEIFGIVSTIIHDNDNPLLPEAVFLMSRLINNCTEQFQPYIEEISQYLIQGFDSEESSIATNFINAYSYIAMNYPEHIAEQAEFVVSKLAQMSPFPSDEEEIITGTSDIALRVGTFLASQYPTAFPPNADAFIEAIRIKKNIHGAKASVFFVKVFESFEDSPEFLAPFVEQIAPILLDIIEQGTCSAAGEAIVAAIDLFPNLALLGEKCDEFQNRFVYDCLEAFTFKLQCLNGVVIFNDEIHPQAKDLLTVAIKSGVYQQIVESVGTLASICESTESIQLKEAILLIISAVAQQTGTEFPQELAVFLLQNSIALIDADDSYAAYSCIGKLAQVKPELLQESVADIYQKFFQKLESLQEIDASGDDEQKMIKDNCLSALCSIIRSFQEIDSFEHFAVLLFRSMPPLFDCDENNNVLSFFADMKENEMSSEQRNEYALVLIRLFCDDVETLKSQLIDEELLMRLIAIFKELSTTMSLEASILQVTGGNDTEQAANVLSVLSD